ncbi:MAG: serine/threonine-protein phosphatase [Planctomycetes bacterium]|nr:serine/threonine-protein phosphatase [Planctomycetota bacterium]
MSAEDDLRASASEEAVRALLETAERALRAGQRATAGLALDGLLLALPADHPQRGEVQALRDRAAGGGLLDGLEPTERLMAPGYLLMAAQDGELTPAETAALEDRLTTADAGLRVEWAWLERARAAMSRVDLAEAPARATAGALADVTARLRAAAWLESSIGSSPPTARARAARAADRLRALRSGGPRKVSLTDLQRRGFQEVKVLRAGDINQLILRAVEHVHARRGGPPLSGDDRLALVAEARALIAGAGAEPPATEPADPIEPLVRAMRESIARTAGTPPAYLELTAEHAAAIFAGDHARARALERDQLAQGHRNLEAKLAEVNRQLEAQRQALQREAAALQGAGGGPSRATARAAGLEAAGVRVAGAGGPFADWFDLVERPDGLDVVLGDPSGRGATAVLAAAAGRSTLQGLLGAGLSPAAALVAANGALKRALPASTFVVAGAGRGSNGRLTLATGGLEGAVVLRAASGQAERLALRGSALGIVEGIERFVRDVEVDLDVGDTVVLVTDGVIDALSPDEEELEWERLVEAVTRHRRLGVEALVDALVAHVRAWTGDRPLDDDVVVVALRRQVG